MSKTFLLISAFFFCCVLIEAGRHNHNNNKLMELLTAGIVAKVLQKQEDHHEGHEYYPVPVHVPVHHHGMHHAESQRHHHHVTEKIIPIPIPHHTTRIIHINAGSHGDNSLGSDSGTGGGNGFHSSGSYNRGHNQFDSQENDDSSSHQSSSSPSIQHFLFHDNGVYGHPMQSPVPTMRHPAYMAYRRPVIGMMPAAATHPYMVRSRYPYIAVQQQMPHPMAAPTQFGAPLYALPYRKIPMAATYVNPMVMRRPPTVAWYG